MIKRRRLLIISIVSVGVTPLATAQPSGSPTPSIREGIDEQRLVTLFHNTRPEANAANDLGQVPDNFPMDHMLLHLKRSPERDAALESYIADLHDPKSPNFHQWLTPDQFAEHYGVATADVETVSGWLRSRGFTVNGAQSNGLMIDFSGTAGMVREAYHTQIHRLNVNGEEHFANMSDPRIPAALAPAITGIVSLHNFMPKPLLVPRTNYTYTSGSSTVHALTAGDIATIYNISPLLTMGISGTGQTIMVVEDTYLYATGDWQVFRKEFGLFRPYPHGSLSQVSPTGGLTCVNPGFVNTHGQPGYGDDGEAAIDVEWASAAAPNAAIVLAACQDTTAFGGLIALENVLNGPAGSLPSVVSISYGETESGLGAAGNAAYSSAYQQAVAEGVSIFVSSGDEDAASSDGGNAARHGITVSGFTSTPYDVSVGGTDFGYTADGVAPSTYWSSTNTAYFNSALSYIQEIPWNDSCAGALATNFINVLLGTSYTPLTFCNSSTGANFRNSIGGSGGPSGCATGVPTVSGVVSGNCAGWPKPSFQAGLFGNPADGVRDIPDVSLFASNGFWDAYYVVCWSNPNTAVGGGFSCTGAPSTWAGFGGTSVSSPIMAGIQALVNQYTNHRWGNPNATYYALANGEYGMSGSAACNSTTVNKIANSCIFYDITQGDNDGACRANSNGNYYNCYHTAAAGTFGVLSTSNASDLPAYPATTGWDFATGIGSVNAYNLVMGWPH